MIKNPYVLAAWDLFRWIGSVVLFFLLMYLASVYEVVAITLLLIVILVLLALGYILALIKRGVNLD